jgi:hypothetical protein
MEVKIRRKKNGLNRKKKSRKLTIKHILFQIENDHKMLRKYKNKSESESFEHYILFR